MERIFGSNTDYSEETLNQLKQVMLLSEQNETEVSVYGKTGMGKAHGIVVDSWFTGFADGDDKRIYFCVYLGETDDANVSSTKAREIAVEIVLEQIADNADMIINGYAFTKSGNKVRILNLKHPSHAAVIDNEEIVETATDDIENVIVLKCYMKNKQFME